MRISEIVALCSGGILLVFGIICMVSYMVKYVKQHGLISLIINIGWIIVGMSVLALYISLWYILPYVTMIGITLVTPIILGFTFADIE